MHISIFLLYAGYTPDDVYSEAQEQAEAEEVQARVADLGRCRNRARKVQRAAPVRPRPGRRANTCVRGRWVGQYLHSATSSSPWTQAGTDWWVLVAVPSIGGSKWSRSRLIDQDETCILELAQRGKEAGWSGLASQMNWNFQAKKTHTGQEHGYSRPSKFLIDRTLRGQENEKRAGRRCTDHRCSDARPASWSS